MKLLLIDEEGLKKQGGSVWLGKGVSSSAVAISLVDVLGRNGVSETIEYRIQLNYLLISKHFAENISHFVRKS